MRRGAALVGGAVAAASRHRLLGFDHPCHRRQGQKIRGITLSPCLSELLSACLQAHPDQSWLFEGEKKHEQYSPRSLQQVVKQAALRAGITRAVTPHMLRHIYAAHLLEAGTDIRYIQDALGRASIKTTEVYTHVARNRMPGSPLDDL